MLKNLNNMKADYFIMKYTGFHFDAKRLKH